MYSYPIIGRLIFCYCDISQNFTKSLFFFKCAFCSDYFYFMDYHIDHCLKDAQVPSQNNPNFSKNVLANSLDTESIKFGPF